MIRNIFTALAFLMGMTVQAQVLVDSDKVVNKFGTDKLVKMTFDGDSVTFETESGVVMNFDITQLHSVGFAEDYTGIEDARLNGEAKILYDAAASVVYVAGSKAQGVTAVYNSEGRLVKVAKANTVSVAELPAGLYIVSYNKKLNAKILKK